MREGGRRGGREGEAGEERGRRERGEGRGGGERRREGERERERLLSRKLAEPRSLVARSMDLSGVDAAAISYKKEEAQRTAELQSFRFLKMP